MENIVVDPIVSEPSKEAVLSLTTLSQLEKLVSVELERDARAVPVLSVVIPVYNEAATIRQVVERIRALPISLQLILVDDGSSDGSREIIQSLQDESTDIFLHAQNQGKGAALQTGFCLAEGEIVIVQDADLEYDPQDILKVIQPIMDGEAEVVYGSRFLASHSNDSWLHRRGNAFLTWLSNTLNGQRLTDMETCYKAIRRTRLRSFVIQQRRFGFEPEITAKIARQKIPIREVPITYQPRSWSEGKKIGFRDLFNALYCIVRYAVLP